MAIRNVPGSTVQYHLVSFDGAGHECVEDGQNLASDAVLDALKHARPAITDILFSCHGWKSDVPAALEQYDRWVAAAAAATADLDRIRQRTPNFVPLIVCLHWPSLPWGNERLPVSSATRRALSPDTGGVTAAIDEIAAATANTAAAKRAIQTILEEANAAKSSQLTSRMLDAYATLFNEAGLRAEGAIGRPGFDQDRFDPQAIVDHARASAAQGNTTEARVLGIANDLKDALLSPMRQLSFWTMKDRARAFGETGAHRLLDAVQLAAPDVRVHLMGHSFGCIAVSAMIAGPRDGSEPLYRPVDSLFLVQGALSLWSYANDVPFSPGSKGYFHRILAERRVRGPIVTTRSSHDNAVGDFYPIGARVKRQRLLGAIFPEYGGIGAFGIQGVKGAPGAPLIADLRINAGDVEFGLPGQPVCNLDASDVICNGAPPSGAHSDIAHAEIAHAFWSAVSAAIGKAMLGTTAPPPPNRAPYGKNSDSFSTPEESRWRRRLLSAGTTRGPEVPQAAPHRTLSGPAPEATGAAPEPTGTSPVAPLVAPATDAPSRWINASFEGLDESAQLLQGKWYQLAFDVDIAARADAVAASPLRDEALAAAGDDDVILTVQLDTDDFDLSGRVSQMRVPRAGRSHTKARFDLSPYRNGRAHVKATIHRDGNFIQQMDLTFMVGTQNLAATEVQARGRALSAAPLLQTRAAGLSIEPRDGGYRCTVWGPVQGHAQLPISAAYLDAAIGAARAALLAVVEQTEGKEPVFQTRIDIPKASSDAALRTLARAGANLLIKLFEGPAAGPDSRAVGAFLRSLCADDASSLKIQILAEHLPIPWGMLYLGDAREGAKLDWNQFLGVRHIVEQIPYQPLLNVWTHLIESDKPALAISVNLNKAIDEQFVEGYVGQQQAFWEKTNLPVTTRLTRADLLKALGDEQTPDQIVYFYCHAVSCGLMEPGGPDASSIILTDKAITLEDFRIDAPANIQLAGKPLVFINACQSSRLSPTFYDGFVPYFMSKGARGVIGTECDTPAWFAMEWAHRFFEKFLGGKELGIAFLELRREFLEQHNNPLGLLYSVHCDANTVVNPPHVIAYASQTGTSSAVP
ncbi:CHAT domain-containing protein [Paraburkholderia sp. J76]|uniref:CHAT domain-containing protein n=1 Tax=Paraburkholderia sp. J76 TaxID=2805439 RepID=UPI002ABD9885|nr:CHAT domain-containing protein [Paraburkholderia sp. J76]